MPRLAAKVYGGRHLYIVGSETPLRGYIAFGVIDRGTNVLQVRPTTLCPLNCIFCSVDAGPMSRHRWAEYIVEPEPLAETAHWFAGYKGGGVEALIDGLGDPLTYPWITRLISLLKNHPAITSVALETHGAVLSKNLVDKLEAAGLDRVNLSIDTLSPEKARVLQGAPWFNLRRVVEAAEYLVRETSIDLHVTPVWIPGVNDRDVEEVVLWAYRIGAGKRWPPVTVQKYHAHRYGRKVPGAPSLPWSVFWKKLEEMEKRLGIRLRWSMEEWGMRYAPRPPCPHRRGDRVCVEAVARGWLRGEMLGVSCKSKWLVALPRAAHLSPGEKIMAEIRGDKDCLLIARVLGKT